MGSAQKVGRNQQDLLAGKTVHVQERGKIQKEGKERNSSIEQKNDFSILQNKHFRLLRARCRLFQPFNMNVSGFIVHFKCFYFV